MGISMRVWGYKEAGLWTRRVRPNAPLYRGDELQNVVVAF